MVAVAVRDGNRRIGAPAAAAAASSASPARPIVVSTSVSPSSSRTRNALTKCARVSWVMWALTVLAFMALPLIYVT